MTKIVMGAAAAAMVMTSGLAVAEAHINLSWPPARYAISGVDQKTGPCGGGTATMAVTEFEPGEEITVIWTETIDHPGHFRIALDMTGTDAFDDPVSQNDMDVAGNIIAYVPDEGGSSFQYTFTVPDVECTGCVLQVIQVMTDKIAQNGFGGYQTGGDDIYYWCADVNIVSGPGATTSSSSTGGGTGGMSGAGGSDPGGAGGSSSPSSGSGQGVDPTGFDNNQGGCSLVAGAGPASGGAGALLLLALGALARRRRERGARR